MRPASPAVAATCESLRDAYFRCPPRLTTEIHLSFAFLQASAALDEPLSAAENSIAASVISSNVSGMLAISMIRALSKAFPAVRRYGSFAFSDGLLKVDLRVGSVWYLSVWYCSHCFDVRYVITVHAASLLPAGAFLGMPIPQPPRTV